MSLTDILDIGKSDYGLEIRKLINKRHIPQDPEELARLKAYTLNKRMYAGKFISEDGKYTVLMCRLKGDAEKETVAREMETVTEALRGDYKVYYGGLPSQMLGIGRLIVDDLKILLPLVVVVVIGALYFSFRSLRGVILPLVNVALANIYAVGLMGWAGIELSLIASAMPIVLISVGSAYGIHLLAKYSEEAHTLSGAERIPLLATALSKVMLPIFLAGLTTLIGFLAFSGSVLTSITEFGVFTAFGVGVAMLLAITFLPAVVSYLPPPKQRPDQAPQHHGNRVLRSILDWVGQMVVRHSKPIITGVAVLVILAAMAIPRITTESNMAKFFDEKSDMLITNGLMREHFGGDTPIQMLITGDLRDPLVLKEMIRMQKYMDSLPDVNNTQSLADLVCEMNDVMNGHYTIPETAEQVANLLFMVEGEDMLDQLVNKEYSEGIIQASFSSPVSSEMIATTKLLNDYIATEMDTRLHVVSVASLDPAAQETLRTFQYERISAAIRQDARNWVPSAQLDQPRLVAEIRQLDSQPFAPLSEASQTTLRGRVDIFLRDEADVIIEDDAMRDDVAAAIVALATTKPAVMDDLPDDLRAIIPEEYWMDDPEALDYTAEFLLPILRDRQQLDRIEGMVAALLPLFPEELQTHPKFREDVRDDLWVLNEMLVGVPTALNLGPAESETLVSSTQSGMLIVVNVLQQGLIRSQLQSLAVALVLITILMSILFRSIKWGLVVTSPVVLTVLVNFAIMGLTHIPLDLATVMIASIVVGIGIDYAIHCATRLKLELNQHADVLQAVDTTLETTGQAILINVLTVALGFLVLVGSQILPLQRFGWILTITMFVSAGATMSFLPAMILVLKRWLRVPLPGDILPDDVVLLDDAALPDAMQDSRLCNEEPALREGTAE